MRDVSSRPTLGNGTAGINGLASTSSHRLKSSCSTLTPHQPLSREYERRPLMYEGDEVRPEGARVCVANKADIKPLPCFLHGRVLIERHIHAAR